MLNKDLKIITIGSETLTKSSFIDEVVAKLRYGGELVIVAHMNEDEDSIMSKRDLKSELDGRVSVVNSSIIDELDLTKLIKDGIIESKMPRNTRNITNITPKKKKRKRKQKPNRR